MRSGPILLLEDDIDDQEIITDALKDLKVDNKVLIFTNGVPALEYLKTTADKPFIIISDVNLPVMNGIEFRRQINIDEHLRRKSIPFIFLSTNASMESVNLAYDLTVQGFFLKGNSYTEVKSILAVIVEYWGKCKHPNST